MFKNLILLLAFVFYTGHAVRAANVQQKIANGNSPAQSATDDKRGTQDSPLMVNTRTIHSNEETAEEARKDAEQHRTNRWNIGLAFAIAICAFLQFCAIVGQIIVYCRQTVIMKKSTGIILRQAKIMGAQARDARKTAAVSNENAQNALEAVSRQADQMERQNTTVRELQRARLTIYMPDSAPYIDTQFRPAPKNGETYVILQPQTMKITNDGPTMAEHVRCEAGIEVTALDGMPSEKKLGTVEIPNPFRVTDPLSPVSLNIHPYGHDIASQQWNQLQRGKLRLHLFGEIAYVDIFGEEHITPFHYYWKIVESSWNEDGFWTNISDKAQA